MTALRLTLAFQAGLDLPEAARIAVFAPRIDTDLSPLPQALCHVITGFKPDYDYFAGLGYACNTAPEGRYGAALICLPRAKDAARDLIAQACAVTDGPVIVDGQKTDGIESALKACRKRLDGGVSAPMIKAHGKLFWFPASDAMADWAFGPPGEIEGGYVTAPGVFSADGVDPGSHLLIDTLPDKLGAHVIDLGAGWGYLSANVLGARDYITVLDAVEANHAALDCARQNVADARARLHWDDALRWTPEALADTVIMNPPFHTGRDADPKLGRAFMAAAAAMLKPAGQLWMVANRHLPYEPTLVELFTESREVAGDSRFKVLHARRPKRAKR